MPERRRPVLGNWFEDHFAQLFLFFDNLAALCPLILEPTRDPLQSNL